MQSIPREIAAWRVAGRLRGAVCAALLKEAVKGTETEPQHCVTELGTVKVEAAKQKVCAEQVHRRPELRRELVCPRHLELRRARLPKRLVDAKTTLG
jgi:hypothetical protein